MSSIARRVELILKSRLRLVSNIALPGWGRAIFPPEIKGLHGAYTALGDVAKATAAAKQLSEFRLLGLEEHPRTYFFDGRSGEFEWEIAYFFKCDGGEVAILFPKKDENGGHRTLHSTAAFGRGAFGDNVRERIALLIKRFAESIRK